MQQYIDTITDQRIKWIDGLRSDFTMIISYIYVSIYTEKVADDWEASYEDYFFSECIDFNGNVSCEDEMNNIEVREKIDYMRKMRLAEKTPKNDANFIKCINLAIMKLNESDPDDHALIQILENAKDYPFYIYDKKDIERDMKKMKCLMSKTLKNEWERVKKEVQKGGLVNGKRKNIFD